MKTKLNLFFSGRNQKESRFANVWINKISCWFVWVLYFFVCFTGFFLGGGGGVVVVVVVCFRSNTGGLNG